MLCNRNFLAASTAIGLVLGGAGAAWATAPNVGGATLMCDDGLGNATDCGDTTLGTGGNALKTVGGNIELNDPTDPTGASDGSITGAKTVSAIDVLSSTVDTTSLTVQDVTTTKGGINTNGSSIDLTDPADLTGATKGDINNAGTVNADTVGAHEIGADILTAFDAKVTNSLTVDGTTTTKGIENQSGGIINHDGIDNTSSGIVNAGAISGATDITASGKTTTGTLAVGTDALVGGNTQTKTLNVTDTAYTHGIQNLSGGITNVGGINTDTLATTSDASIGGKLDVTGQVKGGNIAGAANQIGGTAATSTKIAAGSSYVDVQQNGVTIHGGTTSTNMVVNNAGISVSDTTNGQTFAVSSDGAVTVGHVGGLGTANGVVQVVGAGRNVTLSSNVGDPAINAGGGLVTNLANATLSASSRDAVTGQQLYATNQALAALDAREAAHYGQMLDRTTKAYQGVAMGFAMNAAPLNLANGESGVSGGVGVFQNEWAGAIKVQYVTPSGVGIGGNFGFSRDAVGGGVGASIKF
jgi:hypothetical protein